MMNALEALTRLLALARFDRPQEAAVLTAHVRKSLQDSARNAGNVQVQLQQAVEGQDKALLAVADLVTQVEALEAQVTAKDAEIAELKKPKRRGRKPKAEPTPDDEPAS